MSDLTPAQRIEAAIVRLEKLRSAMSPNTFKMVTWYASGNNSPVSNLTLALYSTVDAQLGLLRNARGGASDLTRGATPDEPSSTDDVMALADAILSGGTE